MAETTRNFIAGRMNKSVDERLIPNGEYVDALNIRLGSTEESEVGSVENAKGNNQLTSLAYQGIPLSSQTKCIGAYEDGQRETLYWFVNDPAHASGVIVDMVVSYNVQQNLLTYHVITADPVKTILNFSEDFLITGVNRVEDLLFWTDNYNQPRFINITRNYNSNSPDLEEQLLVIKKPPVAAPSFQLTNLSGEENFIEERFITFSYRYRYEDGEYSALSQFTEPAFTPKGFNYAIDSGLNEGMTNIFNNVNVTYNSGGPLVKAIEVVFKETTSNVIKSIEVFNKENLGYADNTEYQLSFSNSKIYTVINPTQLFRLFDNVPLLAQAQTIMGNRLIYGNYVDGYDLLDLNTNPLRLEYYCNLISEDIGAEDVPDRTENFNYSIDVNFSATNSAAFFDLDNLDLVAGASIFFDIRYTHFGFTGQTPFPSQTSGLLDLGFVFILPQDFNSVYELATDPLFIQTIGTAANILPVYDPVPGNETSCDGSTITDEWNCVIPNNLDALSKFESGVTSAGQPIEIITSPGSTEIGFVVPAMAFVDDLAAPTQTVYEYYSVSFAEGQYSGVGNPTSLHSDRDYEVGIVYMDEFGRSSTALVSPNNTIHVGCSAAQLQNKIEVIIPPSQIAPSWADRYKLVIKPDFENYNTIYTNIFIDEVSTAATYFLLEGENARKVEEGDRLRVKADTAGPSSRCQYATVLQKEAQTEDFLVPPPLDDSGNPIPIPAGTYMKIIANDFQVTQGDNPTILPGGRGTCRRKGNRHPKLGYPVNIADEGNPGQFVDYTLPAGSRINLYVRFQRRGKGNSCDGRTYTLDLKLTASQDYDNFKEWFDGDNIASRLDQGTASVSGSPDCLPPYYANYYNPALGSDVNNMPTDRCIYQWQFQRNATTNQLVLGLVGTNTCKGSGRATSKRACIDANIEVFRAENTLVFETEPRNATPDLWYESADVYSIDKATGRHEGNVQNQTGSASAIVLADFFNCFSFGNGVESYRIRDSIIGKEFSLGERTTSTSELEFRQAHRFSDLTYSGVYNNESNVNKLNEFNLGLLNFKPLEDIYGPIEKLSGRETDILVLQEDKISYVLAGKNLLSDSAGGGTIASVPEVLGTQLARIEEYGISRNPESFCAWGYDKYFTDAKRGAVIKLTGSAGQNEQLTVVSEAGMRSWFRDRFKDSLNKQKIGGFDPYMNEYVLSMNDEELPSEEVCIACGIERTFTFPEDKTFEYCIDLGLLVGNTDIEIIASNSSGSSIGIIYNGLPVVPTTTLSDGTTTFTFDKNVVSENESQVTLSGIAGATIQVTVKCPVADIINVYQVCITNSTDVGKNIHNEYRWIDGTYQSPLHSQQVSFIDGTDFIIISQFDSITAPQGAGVVPADNASVQVICNKRNTDNFVFEPTENEFYALRTNTTYTATPADIISLITAAGTALPLDVALAPEQYIGNYTMTATGSNLYLVYDYRQPTEAELCFGTIDALDVCCDCVVPPTGPPDATLNLTQQFFNCTDPSTGFSYKPQASATLAKCGMDDFFTDIVQGDYSLSQCTSQPAFQYYSTYGITVGSQLYENGSPVGASRQGFYLYRGSLNGPSDIQYYYVDPTNTSYIIPNDWFLLEIAANGTIASITQYNTITCI